MPIPVVVSISSIHLLLVVTWIRAVRNPFISGQALTELVPLTNRGE
jgi:hypothetical protein